MSHLKERTEKTCLNCQAELIGRYCHACGQENLEPKETVWHLVQHFFNDITHFDGKFFSTVKYLIRKPGFLSYEYMLGRRASYLNPIRMYVFTSAIFFIIFFSLRSGKDIVGLNETPDKPEVRKGIPELQKDSAKLAAQWKKDNAGDKKDTKESLDRITTEIVLIKRTYGDTTTLKFTRQERALILVKDVADSLDLSGLSADLQKTVRDGIKAKQNEQNDEGGNFFGWHQGRFKSLAAYDSTQRVLPDSLKDGWLKYLMMRRLVKVDEVYHHDKHAYAEHLGENLLHSIPKILFFSLPFFALLLRLLYVRRKQYYYVSHGIFAIHVYCATFILGLGIMLLNALSKGIHAQWLHVVTDIATFLIVLYMLFYLYKAMRTFYKQRRAKTILKYILLGLMAFVVNMIIFIIFVLISAITV